MPVSHLFFVASAFLLALGSVIARHFLSLDQASSASIDPLPFLCLQLFGGIAFLVVVRLARGWQRIPAADLCRPACAGIVLGMGSIGTIMALALISASEASVVFATQPVMILGLAWIVLREKTPIETIILALLAVTGVIVIVVGGGFDTSSKRFLGLSFALISTASSAIYVVWMRGLSAKLDQLSALIVVLSVAFLVAALAWTLVTGLGLASTSAGSILLGLSAFGIGTIYYGAAFWIYLVGLRKTDASIAGVYLSLVPVFAIGLAYVFLAERLTHLQSIGAATVTLAVGALALITAKRSRSV